MDIQTTVIDIIDNLFMEDISDMMDEDLFDAGVLDSMGTVELVIELEEKFNKQPFVFLRYSFAATATLIAPKKFISITLLISSIHMRSIGRLTRTPAQFII